MSNLELRRVSGDEAEPGAAILARAFHETALFCLVTPEPEERRRITRALFTVNLRHACRHGEAWAAVTPSGEMRGVIYLVDRPEPNLTEAETAELGFADLAARWGTTLHSLAAIENDGLQPLANVPLPWRYLAALGVDPDHQGQGIGAMLVTKALADAHAAGLRCGLVTDDARNVAFYRRHGFHLLRDASGPDGHTRFWTMLTGDGASS